MGNRSSIIRGDVVLIRYPFTDLSSDKRRPAIFISAFPCGGDGHFVFIGSTPPVPGIRAIPVPPGRDGLSSMGLRADSYVYPHKIATLELSLMTTKLGTTPLPLLQQITSEMALALGV